MLCSILGIFGYIEGLFSTDFTKTRIWKGVLTMQLAGKTVEFLYSNDCAILPFRWSNGSSGRGSFSDQDDDDSSRDISSRFHIVKAAGNAGRSTRLTSSKGHDSDGIDTATYGKFRSASKDGGVSIGNQQSKTDFCNEEQPQEQTSSVTKQGTPLTASFESTPTSTSTERVEHLDWQEERKRWISAAGVRTPAELERKLADMYRIGAHNEAAVKLLSCHVTEVKTEAKMLLQELHDEIVAKGRKRPDRTRKKRKRSRIGCIVDTEDSSTECVRERKVGPLLDPKIMSSFGNLIKTSA